MSEFTIRCRCGVYLHATDLTAEQILDLIRTWAEHRHDDTTVLEEKSLWSDES